MLLQLLRLFPGMLKYNNAYIEILEIPGLIEGAKEGKRQRTAKCFQ